MTSLAFRLPRLGHACLAGLLLALALPGIRPAAAASVDCPDAGLLGPALLGQHLLGLRLPDPLRRGGDRRRRRPGRGRRRCGLRL